MTKFQKYALIGFLVYAVIIMIILSNRTNTTHKYAVGYTQGKWSYEDYTDTFQVSSGVVTYIDEDGVEVARYGTFSIKKNGDCKK